MLILNTVGLISLWGIGAKSRYVSPVLISTLSQIYMFKRFCLPRWFDYRFGSDGAAWQSVMALLCQAHITVIPHTL